MREFLVSHRVLVNVARLFHSIKGRFDIDQNTRRHLFAVDFPVDARIMNLADGAVSATVVLAFIVRAGKDGKLIFKLDRNSQINANLAHRAAEILKLASFVLAGVADDDEAATPQHHFVKPEVFKMAAIGKIHKGLIRISKSERFDDRAEGECWRGASKRLLALRARIAEPPAEPRIKQAQQKSDRRR